MEKEREKDDDDDISNGDSEDDARNDDDDDYISNGDDEDDDRNTIPQTAELSGSYHALPNRIRRRWASFVAPAVPGGARRVGARTNSDSSNKFRFFK